MSYDIQFGVKVAGAEDIIAVIGEPEYSSPTYNIREIFVKSMDWDYKQSTWYPMTEVIPKLERGIRELTFNEKEYVKYNAPNGWGTTQTALKSLRSIYEWFGETEIPVEYIYMRW